MRGAEQVTRKGWMLSKVAQQHPRLQCPIGMRSVVNGRQSLYTSVVNAVLSAISCVPHNCAWPARVILEVTSKKYAVMMCLGVHRLPLCVGCMTFHSRHPVA